MPILTSVPTYRAQCDGCGTHAQNLAMSLPAAEQDMEKLKWKRNIHDALSVPCGLKHRAATADCWYCPECVKAKEEKDVAVREQARKDEAAKCPACCAVPGRAHTEVEKKQYHPLGDFREGEGFPRA